MKKVATATAKKRAAAVKKKPAGPGALVVDTATVAKYFGVSQRTIRHWAKVEGLPKMGQNKYSLVAVRLWEIGRLKKEIAEQQFDDKRLKRYSADEREHRAELLRMRMLKMQGLLIDKGAVERKSIEKIIAVKSGLKMLAQRIAGRIEGVDVEKIVDEEVVLCCLRFAGEGEIAAAVKKKKKKEIKKDLTTKNTKSTKKMKK